MDHPRVEYRYKSRRLSPSQGVANSVYVMVHTKSEEILQNLTTGHQTLLDRSTSVSPSLFFGFSLQSTSNHHIQSLLHGRLINHDQLRFCQEDLASRISTAATDLGFGHTGFSLTVNVTVIQRNFLMISSDLSPTTNDEALIKMVLCGMKELKSLTKETKPCSICLESLTSREKPTGMKCSHVFHGGCILEWLHRKNTCPLCRTVLYEG